MANRFEISKNESVNLLVQTCLENGVTDQRQVAFVLATAQHETMNFTKPEEIDGRGQARKLGYRGGEEFFGRGYVHLTHKDNYEKFDRLLGLNGELVKHPEMAKEPEIAAKIMVLGMRDGLFTGKKMGSYINDENTDYYNARRTVNGISSKSPWSVTAAEDIQKFAKYWDDHTPQLTADIQQHKINTKAPVSSIDQTPIVQKPEIPAQAHQAPSFMDGVLAKGNGLIDVADKKLDETFKDVKDNVQGAWNKVTGLFDGDESPTKQAVNRTQEPASNGKTVVAGLSQVAQQFADMAKKTVDQKHEHHPQHATGAKSHANNGVFDKGDRGDDVKHVQTMLASLGAKVGVDGIYGHETERAVKGYQMMNGLEADGIVGPKTMAALKEDAQRVPTQSGAAPVQVEPKYQGSPDKYVPLAQTAKAAQPELSNTAQGLIVDAKTHIQNWIAANGLQWNEQFNQAAHSVASAAHEKGMTGINLFAVNGGQIDFGHKEGFMLKTGSVETAVASNTDISKSLQAMADVDQKQIQTQVNTEQQTFAQNKEHSGVQRG